MPPPRVPFTPQDWLPDGLPGVGPTLLAEYYTPAGGWRALCCVLCAVADRAVPCCALQILVVVGSWSLRFGDAFPPQGPAHVTGHDGALQQLTLLPRNWHHALAAPAGRTCAALVSPLWCPVPRLAPPPPSPPVLEWEGWDAETGRGAGLALLSVNMLVTLKTVSKEEVEVITVEPKPKPHGKKKKKPGAPAAAASPGARPASPGVGARGAGRGAAAGARR